MKRRHVCPGASMQKLIAVASLVQLYFADPTSPALAETTDTSTVSAP